MKNEPHQLREPVEAWVLAIFIGSLLSIPLLIYLIALVVSNADVIDKASEEVTKFLVLSVHPAWYLLLIVVLVIRVVSWKFKAINEKV